MTDLEELRGEVNMKKYYFTFGQTHTHSCSGKTLDKDIVVCIKAKSSNQARDRMFELFGAKWSMQYDELPDMSYYPRGVYNL